MAAPSSHAAGGSAFVHRAELLGGISLYEVPGTVDLVYWADRVEPVPDVPTAVERLTCRPDQAASTASVLVEWDAQTPVPAPGGGGTVSWQRPAGHDLRLQVDAPTGGFLVFNESYDPGWHAWLDGQPVVIRRTNAVCQGLLVPPGQHEIHFSYRPRGLWAGAIISGLAIVVLAAGFRLPWPGVVTQTEERTPHAVY